MRTIFAPATAVVLLLFLSSCAAPRYATYKPPGGAVPEWKVKAEKDFGGMVTVTVNDTEVLKGQYPIFGEREVKGKYQGRDITMVLRKSPEARVTVFECLLYAEGNQIGYFKW